MKISTIIGTGLVLAISAVTLAAVQGFTIKNTQKVGDTLKFKLKASLEIMGQQAKFSAITTEKITKVEADGGYTAEESQSEAKVQLGDQEIEPPASGPQVLVHKANGVVTEIRGDNVDASTYRMNVLSLFVPSEKEVKIGDTWVYETKADAKLGTVAAKAEYKVLGEEKVGDFETLKIKCTVKETEGSDPASSESTVWLDKADWRPVKMEGKWVNAPMPGAPSPITATVSMERIK